MTSYEYDSPLIILPNTYRAFYGSFNSLNLNQKKSIPPILAGKDFILQAATGSGKTEAVLAPCLERIIQSGTKKSVIYIVPTRALALDMERRLNPILVDKLDLSLGIRTGDAKRFSGGNPDLLLTTPESLDVMLGSSNTDFRKFFQQIGAIIIDEVHSLTYTYRGQQLTYLLKRIEHRSAGFQRIALSATIGSIEAVTGFFNFKPNLAEIAAPVHREVIPHLVSLKNDMELVALLDDLYREWNYKKILIFTNNRGACDRIFILLNEEGCFQGKVELHYSNITTKERRKVEQRFRKNRHSLCVATSTLELGVDIGDVDVVLLYEPPDSVSAFLQRIGRGNRRKNHTHFWGISRGPQTRRQLLRFLGLLKLSQQGKIEQHNVKKLHSVLIQQILSCLYEKKQISLPALQNLFPDKTEIIAMIFERLIHHKWLRPAHFKGLFRGGWRYRDLLLEYKIWSNFPEVEEDYSLEVAGEIIADIPASVIKQLDPGDCVTLTGKRLKVLKIIKSKERKSLLAEPVEKLDEKEIFWLGCGFKVSFEVAQAIKTILIKPDNGTNKELGLFSRTTKLLELEIEQIKDAVILMNEIMVSRKPNGMYRYWTFLGSMGNLILQWCIDHGPGKELEEFYIVSDETGLDCSHLIDFKKLNLPEDKKKFQTWVSKHTKPLQALVSINSFARFLPRNIFIEELTDFLFDQRVADIFSGYLTLSSKIKSGDPAILELTTSILHEDSVKIVHEVSVESILNREKKRWKINNEPFIISPGMKYKKRALTGTIIGEFIRHQQCKLWLGYMFVPDNKSSPGSTITNKEFRKSRIERGRLNKKKVLEYLKTECNDLITIKDEYNEKSISLDKRAELTIKQLRSFLSQIKESSEKRFIIAHGVLISPSLNKGFIENAIGIPDIIRITTQNSTIVLEVGDIKESNIPLYYQKWQIVFYAFLLKSIIGQLGLKDINVSHNGILLTRSDQQNSIPLIHFFDMKHYLASLPQLIEQINSTLQKNISELGFKLNTHCTSCSYFDQCYIEALSRKDIILLPQLTPGILENLYVRGLNNIELAYSGLTNTEDLLFSTNQKRIAKEIITSFKKNKIYLREEKTRLFPANISTSIFFHVLENPYTGLPYSFGWEARVPGNGIHLS